MSFSIWSFQAANWASSVATRVSSKAGIRSLVNLLINGVMGVRGFLGDFRTRFLDGGIIRLGVCIGMREEKERSGFLPAAVPRPIRLAFAFLVEALKLSASKPDKTAAKTFLAGPAGMEPCGRDEGEEIERRFDNGGRFGGTLREKERGLSSDENLSCSWSMDLFSRVFVEIEKGCPPGGSVFSSASRCVMEVAGRWYCDLLRAWLPYEDLGLDAFALAALVP